jgi:hypothetical protein
LATLQKALGVSGVRKKADWETKNLVALSDGKTIRLITERGYKKPGYSLMVCGLTNGLECRCRFDANTIPLICAPSLGVSASRVFQLMKSGVLPVFIKAHERQYKNPRRYVRECDLRRFLCIDWFFAVIPTADDIILEHVFFLIDHRTSPGHQVSEKPAHRIACDLCDQFERILSDALKKFQ